MDLQTAQRLYEFRKANGFPQKRLLIKIGVSRQAISKWCAAKAARIPII
jgi:transcriptional regulator with XRE-family HTH domain